MAAPCRPNFGRVCPESVYGLRALYAPASTATEGRGTTTSRHALAGMNVMCTVTESARPAKHASRFAAPFFVFSLYARMPSPCAHCWGAVHGPTVAVTSPPGPTTARGAEVPGNTPRALQPPPVLFHLHLTYVLCQDRRYSGGSARQFPR